MENLEDKLNKTQTELDNLLSVSWCTLSEDDQKAYATRYKKATDEIEELQQRIAAIKEELYLEACKRYHQPSK